MTRVDEEGGPGFLQETIRVFPDGRISAADAGKVLGRTPKTMAEWRCKGWGPKPIRVGNRIFHQLGECLEMARGTKPIKPAPIVEV